MVLEGDRCHHFPLSPSTDPSFLLLTVGLAGFSEEGEPAAAVRLAQRHGGAAGTRAAVSGLAGSRAAGECAGAHLLQEHR